MTAKLESFVPAAPPQAIATPTPVTPTAQALVQRETRQAARAAVLARWKAITEAGGQDEWVHQQLVARGALAEEVDFSSLKEKEKTAWKEKKKAEATERRALKRLAYEAWKATHIGHLGAGIHWNEEGGADAFDIPHREERAKSNGLPEFTSAEDVAKALGLGVSKLRWFAFHREVDTATHYTSWRIPKRDGGSRTITSPKTELKAAQRWVLSNIVERLPVHGAAHGFVAGRSILTNALAHRGADVVVKVDVKDFFPSVTWPRVKGLLRKGGLPENIATLLALLATEAPREAVSFRGKTLYVAQGPRALPQGAPTSPGITNALCLRLDKRLSALSRKLGFVYTRYADDLTFSWTKAKAPKARRAQGAPVAVLLARVQEVVEAEGFRLHPDKTRVARKGSRQRVTGLVVNDAGPKVPAARVPRDVVRRLRAALHNREQGKPGKEGESLEQLQGMAAFIHMTDPAKGRAFMERLEKLSARPATTAA
ncbi:RNA-directed DNA polymerase [Corallococcus sp. H22C18031201]|uniref:reverse transcriptase family protein n=1 Tax=Citreicoccus inhibens TaxID=2849499 RepID=UPI000E7454A3|nr:reverse transcriptase family protein [Citreicoccus inhibens]MBU8898467.1 reverse transcriptase family protein [Citreicoccus inhibens]RJS21313.1 RNA-directed DNA polymerase [Corallococcus sp. H22C18031201]